jgi:hypothetical protein
MSLDKENPVLPAKSSFNGFAGKHVQRMEVSVFSVQVSDLSILTPDT